MSVQNKSQLNKLGVVVCLVVVVVTTSGCYFSEIKVKKEVSAYLLDKYHEEFVINDVRQNMMLPIGGEYHVLVSPKNIESEIKPKEFEIVYHNEDYILDERHDTRVDDLLTEQTKQKLKTIFEGSDFYLGYGVKTSAYFGNCKTLPELDHLDQYIRDNRDNIGVRHKILFIVDNFAEVSIIVEILKNHLSLFENCDSYESFSIAFTSRSMMFDACEALDNSSDVWIGNENAYFFDVDSEVTEPQDLMHLIAPTEVGRIINIKN